MRGIAGVARKEYLASAHPYDKTAPERAIAVAGAATRPMLSGCQRDRCIAHLDALPPVELMHGAQAVLAENRFVSQARDHSLLMPGFVSGQCIQVQVVVVVVADQDQVDWRQLIKRQSRGAYAFRASAAQWANALGVYGVRQDVQAAKLDEEGDVIDERQGDLSLRELCGQSGAGAILNPHRPAFGLGSSPPSQKLRTRASRGSIRVKEMSAIKMIGRKAVVARPSADRTEQGTQDAELAQAGELLGVHEH